MVVRLLPETMNAFRRAITASIFAEQAYRENPIEALSESVHAVVRSILERLGAPLSEKQRAPIVKQPCLTSALAYIESQLRQPISMADVCRSTHIGIRTLERLFVKELGVPPSEYIKARRLNAVRRHLISANPEDVRIGEVAYDQGFTHLGRFSGDYKRFFGERPRDTLANRR